MGAAPSTRHWSSLITRPDLFSLYKAICCCDVPNADRRFNVGCHVSYSYIGRRLFQLPSDSSYAQSRALLHSRCVEERTTRGKPSSVLAIKTSGLGQQSGETGRRTCQLAQFLWMKPRRSQLRCGTVAATVLCLRSIRRSRWSAPQDTSLIRLGSEAARAVSTQVTLHSASPVFQERTFPVVLPATSFGIPTATESLSRGALGAGPMPSLLNKTTSHDIPRCQLSEGEEIAEQIACDTVRRQIRLLYRLHIVGVPSNGRAACQTTPCLLIVNLSM